MNGKRRLARSPGRLFLLASVLALLASACFVAPAYADSSGVQYSDAPPTAYGDKEPTDREPPAKSSAASDGGASAPRSGDAGQQASSGGGQAEDSSAQMGAAAGTGSDGGTGQQGSRDNGSTGNREARSGETVGQSVQSASSEDDGGSSPLIPIVIGILALAGVSLATVMIRQRRRQDAGGAAVSPKAS